MRYISPSHSLAIEANVSYKGMALLEKLGFKSEDAIEAERKKKERIAKLKDYLAKKAALVIALLFVHSTAFAAEIPTDLAIKAIMGEASNQGFDGMVAVGEAIRNRGTLKGVYGVNAKHIYKEPDWVWNQARKAWEVSKTSNLVKKADHWENTKAFGTPYWAKNMVKTAQIKDHSFYRRANK